MQGVGVSKPLIVATDCSGIETPIVVLRRLGIPFRHLFSSDSNPSVRRYIKGNFSPETLYESVYDRPIHCATQLDLYVAGPPCTAASDLNRHQCEQDRDVAFQVGRNCFEFVAASQPYAFVIKNVPRSKTVRGGSILRDWMSLLPDGLYDVEKNNLNSRYYSCPQNRNRFYLIGVRRDNPHGWTPRFPPRVPLTISADSLLLDTCPVSVGLTNNQSSCIKNFIPSEYSYGFNIHNMKTTLRLNGRWIMNNDGVSNCLTSQSPAMYSTKFARRLVPIEHARLQGFLDGEVDTAFRGVERMIGNAMNASVLSALLCNFISQPV
jgi:site-specific DNA-cytosine methylase